MATHARHVFWAIWVNWELTGPRTMELRVLFCFQGVEEKSNLISHLIPTLWQLKLSKLPHRGLLHVVWDHLTHTGGSDEGWGGGYGVKEWRGEKESQRGWVHIKCGPPHPSFGLHTSWKVHNHFYYTRGCSLSKNEGWLSSGVWRRRWECGVFWWISPASPGGPDDHQLFKLTSWQPLSIKVSSPWTSGVLLGCPIWRNEGFGVMGSKAKVRIIRKKISSPSCSIKPGLPLPKAH